MRALKMTEIGGANIELLEIDDDLGTEIGTGGFGAILAVRGRPNVVVKQINIDPPRTVADIRRYTAHIWVTKNRLQQILDEERRRPRADQRWFIINYITEILDYSLSTHWACDLDDQGKITAVWLLQKKASGTSLKDLFSDRTTPPPGETVRKKIAKDVVSRMRTLRRADLVHLDCVHENIFYDPGTGKVTVIDLDGCGIVDRRPHGGAANEGFKFHDDWEYPPFTLGHTTLVRLPPWYPQARVECGPRTGNYLFGERWVALDTVIRILTWNRLNILSWLKDTEMRKQLGTAYKDIKRELDEYKTRNPQDDAIAWWTDAWRTRLEDLTTRFCGRLPTHPGQFWVIEGYPSCLAYFSDIAQQAYFDPQTLSAHSDSRSLYEVYFGELV